MYDTDNFFYLYVIRSESGEKMLIIIVSELARISYPLGKGVETDKYFDHSILSDDYYMEKGEYRFTGAFVGLCCQDCYSQESYADFDWFEYREEK